MNNIDVGNKQFIKDECIINSGHFTFYAFRIKLLINKYYKIYKVFIL